MPTRQPHAGSCRVAGGAIDWPPYGFLIRKANPNLVVFAGRAGVGRGTGGLGGARQVRRSTSPEGRRGEEAGSTERRDRPDASTSAGAWPGQRLARNIEHDGLRLCRALCGQAHGQRFVQPRLVSHGGFGWLAERDGPADGRCAGILVVQPIASSPVLSGASASLRCRFEPIAARGSSRPPAVRSSVRETEGSLWNLGRSAKRQAAAPSSP